MKKRALWVLAVLAFAQIGLAQPPPPPPPPVPYCAICLGEGFACWANYGVNCTPPAGVPHCTEAQAGAYCPGWVKPGTVTPDNP
jgi:hypothetical protein